MNEFVKNGLSKTLDLLKEQHPKLYESGNRFVDEMIKDCKTYRDLEMFEWGYSMAVDQIKKEKVPQEVDQRFMLIWAILADRKFTKKEEINNKLKNL